MFSPKQPWTNQPESADASSGLSSSNLFHTLIAGSVQRTIAQLWPLLMNGHPHFALSDHKAGVGIESFGDGV